MFCALLFFIRKPLAWWVVVSICWGAQAPESEYVDRKTNLVIACPKGWRVEGGWPAFTLVNFPSRIRPKQAIVPVDGAEIVVVPRPTTVASVSDWLAFDRLQEKSSDRLSHSVMALEHFGKVKVTIVHFDEPLIPGGKGTVFYLMLGTTPCKVSLFYRGDKNAEYFGKTVRAVIASLRSSQ